MKVNQWTLGLAAAGVISFGAVAQAEEKPSNQVLTAVSSTVLSGYVSTSVHWNPGQSRGFGGSGAAVVPGITTAAAGTFAVAPPAGSPAGTPSPGSVTIPAGTPITAGTPANPRQGSSYLANKGDGFNLDVVNITVSKALDESEWSAGYTAELWLGPDAAVLGNNLGGTANGDLALAQAFVALNVPIGNGLVVKVGTFNTIIGYEGNNSPDNPNYSRSYGYTFGPFQHEGIVATYKVCDGFSATAGVANAQNTGLGLRAPGGVQSQKTYLAAISLTAPDSFGFLKGAVLNAGIVNGAVGAAAPAAGGSAGEEISNIHVSATIPTPWESIKTGVSWDHLNLTAPGVAKASDADSFAVYASFKNVGIEKLSLNTRVEYFDNGGGVVALGGAAVAGTNIGNAATAEVLAATVTADYQLWANVISRLEYRWDHDLSGNRNLPGNVNNGAVAGGNNNAHLIALNLIYKF